MILGAALCLYSATLLAQGNVLTIAPPAKVTAKAGATVEINVTAQLRNGYHCNSNTPSEDYLIPLKLTWTPGPLEPAEVVYPKAHMEKYSFSDVPLSVYTGDFVIATKFKVAASANPGTAFLSGKLRYQACNDRMCLPPKTIDVSVPVDVVK